MKMVSFRVRNFDKEQFLTFNIDNEAELDEDVLDFLEDEEPRGIVPVIFEDDDEEFDTFSYDITNKIHLSELSNQEINAEMVLMVLRGITIALTDMAEYRIPLSYLVLHRDYIYIDSDYKVEFICIPLEEMQEEVNIQSFLRNFIASLRFDVTEDVSYVARLLTYVNNTALFNLRNLLTMVEELMEEHGIEIPEDNSSEIYADYQEVEEKSAVDLVEELDEAEDSEELAEEVIDDAPAEEENIPDEEEPEEEAAQQEKEETSDKQEPKKSGLSSKFSIKQPTEDEEEQEYEEEEPEEVKPKKSSLSSKFSLKEPEPDEEETAVTEEETAEETDDQSGDDAAEPSEEQSEETVGEEEAAEEVEEEVAEETVEEEAAEEDEPQEELSEETEQQTGDESQAEEEPEEDELQDELPLEDELQEDEPPVEDESQKGEPSVDEAVQDSEDEETAGEAVEADVKEEAAADSTAQEIVNKLKSKVIGGRKKTNASENEESGEGEEDKKKPVFKTKEVTGVVIPDELDEFLAEKEREEQENMENHHEESSLKIKKNIKVNRASIVKSTQEELKENESAEEETESDKTDTSENIKDENGEAAADTGAEQSGGGIAGILKSAPPKVNPYLVRVNTEERIMITKQTFKMGKASMGVDYTVKGNSAVSRVHAIITSKDGEYFVKDNKSTNHTYVNGKILNEGDNEPLTHDSKIMLGDEEFIFKLQ
ncbi:MAG: FHA domain-containing protein [Clostridium sp.]|nr:FHA domain-containing protein [Clostridium sp.]